MVTYPSGYAFDDHGWSQAAEQRGWGSKFSSSEALGATDSADQVGASGVYWDTQLATHCHRRNELFYEVLEDKWLRMIPLLAMLAKGAMRSTVTVASIMTQD